MSVICFHCFLSKGAQGDGHTDHASASVSNSRSRIITRFCMTWGGIWRKVECSVSSRMYPLVCHCAQENRLHKSRFETLGKLFPVREGNFPDPVILLARFGIFLTGFLGRSNPTDYGIMLYSSNPRTQSQNEHMDCGIVGIVNSVSPANWLPDFHTGGFCDYITGYHSNYKQVV